MLARAAAGDDDTGTFFFHPYASRKRPSVNVGWMAAYHWKMPNFSMQSMNVPLGVQMNVFVAVQPASTLQAARHDDGHALLGPRGQARQA